MESDKLVVDIWSDIRCPFCYIGKNRFEKALEQFEHKDRVQVNWRSFELDKNIQSTGTDIFTYFQQHKGIARPQAEGMMKQVRQAGLGVGLNLKVEQTILANSFNAHQLVHFAKDKGLGNEAKAKLFESHFTLAEDISDASILARLVSEIGLDEYAWKLALQANAFADAVRQDEAEAEALDIQGVPFFVFQQRYAVSGAQAPELFLEVLEKTWAEFKATSLQSAIAEGESCSIGENC